MLEDLEHLTVHRGSRGQGFVYELARLKPVLDTAAMIKRHLPNVLSLPRFCGHLRQEGGTHGTKNKTEVYARVQGRGRAPGSHQRQDGRSGRERHGPDRIRVTKLGEAIRDDERRSPRGPLTTEERAEMSRLRRELKTVTMERDFLKKLQPSSPGAHDDVCARLGGGSCLPEGAHEPGPWPVPFRASCIPHAKGVTTCAGPTKA